MEFFYFMSIFIFGSAIGSFLGVVIERIPREESITKGRSYCESCKRRLAPLDLIPLFSFLFLRGKCRYCKTKLSLYYPLVEFITGLLFVLVAFIFFGNNLLSVLTDTRSVVTLGALWYLSASLVALFFIDLKYGILPFVIIFPAVLVTVLWHLVIPQADFVNLFLSAFGAFLFFLCLFLATKGRGMGFGDVVYAFLMGLLLGFPKIIFGLYIAFIGGAIISLLLVALKRKKLSGGTVPFGPFLIAGTIISLLWGQELIAMVVRLTLHN